MWGETHHLRDLLKTIDLLSDKPATEEEPKRGKGSRNHQTHIAKHEEHNTKKAADRPTKLGAIQQTNQLANKPNN